MPKATPQDLSSRLNAIADEVMETSSLEKDELSAHLWILRSVTIRDYADSVALLHAKAAQKEKPLRSGTDVPRGARRISKELPKDRRQSKSGRL